MCRALHYFEHFLFFSAVSVYVSTYGFASLVGVLVGVASSAIGLQSCALTAGIKKYKSIIKKKRKNHNNIVLSAKSKLYTIQFLISKVSIHSHINHDEFALVNNVLREYNEMEEEIKNPENAVQYTI